MNAAGVLGKMGSFDDALQLLSLVPPAEDKVADRFRRLIQKSRKDLKLAQTLTDDDVSKVK